MGHYAYNSQNLYDSYFSKAGQALAKHIVNMMDLKG